MRRRIALLAALAEAVWSRQAHEFDWLVKAAYGAGASLEDLLTAVESGCLLGKPPAPIVTEAYATVHAWQWLAICGPGNSRESTPCPEWGRTERMEAWIPWTTR
jgi:hypothetical protein